MKRALAAIAIVVIVVSAAAAANFTLTVTPSSGGIACTVGPNFTGTIPLGATAGGAGLTACVANYDFTTTTSFVNAKNGITYNFSNINSWLDCAGSANPLWWVRPYLRGSNAPCAAFSIINDGGTNALDLHWDPSYFSATNSAYLENSPDGSAATGLYFPLNVYIELKTRVTTASYNGYNGAFGAIGDLFTWTNTSLTSDPAEWDQFETGTDGGWASGGIPRSGTSCAGFNGPHFGTNSYHVVGTRVNIDSNKNVYCATYIDNVNGVYQTPGVVSFASDSRTYRNWIKMGTGPQNSSTNSNNPMDTMIEWIHVFSCPSWATGQCLTAPTGP